MRMNLRSIGVNLSSLQSRSVFMTSKLPVRNPLTSVYSCFVKAKNASQFRFASSQASPPYSSMPSPQTHTSPDSLPPLPQINFSADLHRPVYFGPRALDWISANVRDRSFVLESLPVSIYTDIFLTSVDDVPELQSKENANDGLSTSQLVDHDIERKDHNNNQGLSLDSVKRKRADKIKKKKRKKRRRALRATLRREIQIKRSKKKAALEASQ